MISMKFRRKNYADAFSDFDTQQRSEFNKRLNNYVGRIVDESKKHITTYYSWWSSDPNSIESSLIYQRIEEGRYKFKTRRPDGYMKQWGETTTGKTRILPVNSQLLFINKTGLTSAELKSMGWKEFYELGFLYGEHYSFARSAEVRSMPFLQLPIPASEVGSLAERGVLPRDGLRLQTDFVQEVGNSFGASVRRRMRSARWVRN